MLGGDGAPPARQQRFHFLPREAVVHEVQYAGIRGRTDHTAGRLHDALQSWIEIGVFVTGTEQLMHAALQLRIHRVERRHAERRDERADQAFVRQVDAFRKRTSENGKADAFLAFPPEPQQMRVKKIGSVIVNTSQDRPWNQYYCSLIAARPQFVSQYPVATKRAVRAILKATDICAREPERAAKYNVAKGYEPSYEIALEVVKSLSYDGWRRYDPEDSLRFFGVRLHEVGMIKTSPNKLIAKGTDWRFLNELKRELKA